MFEKEAEELIEESKRLNTTPRETVNKAIEFGYNKADEWHYVKNELPPEDVPLICLRGGKIYVAWLVLGKWKDNNYKDIKKPYAWKEIVLPKETK